MGEGGQGLALGGERPGQGEGWAWLRGERGLDKGKGGRGLGGREACLPQRTPLDLPLGVAVLTLLIGRSSVVDLNKC